jgi:CheY-like chemotaxis protein
MAKRIMVVDDDPTIQASVRAALSFLGYEVISSNGGLECIEQLVKHGPVDLILLDIMMENVSGETVFAALTKRAPNTRVVFMSALQPSEQSIKIMQAKGWGITHITKPFTIEKLKAVVQKVLQEKASTGQPPTVR